MAVWQIRPATLHDAGKLAECIAAAYAAHTERVSDLPAVSDGIAEDIETSIVRVAEIQGHIAGGIVLIPGEGFLRVANVAVHPGHSGLGLGRALLETAEQEAANLGLHELRLSTHTGLPENVALYTHLGWQEAGRDEIKVRMRKRLV